MANSLDKFYNVFGGIDTRSNRMLQPPGSFRKGSKNFRYNFQDEIQNANGFQHKDSGAPSMVDIFEYKYRDVNTGAALTQILGVGLDGHLYRKKDATLSFVSHGAATSVSVFFDEVANTFKMVLNGLGSVNISDTMTLAQLETALELLPGVSVTITGDSSKLAYLLDCVIENDFQQNSVFYWERVPFPDIVCVAVTPVTEANIDFENVSQYTFNSVPFPTTLKAQTDQIVGDNYEGISSINLNNCIYITDGGFPMKYDGKTVYRAGMPKNINNVNADYSTVYGTENETGITYTSVTPASVSLTGLPAALYKYQARFAFIDYFGAVTYGPIIEKVGVITPPPPAAAFNTKIDTKGIYYGPDFPIYAAKVNGQQSAGVGGAGIVLTVHSGHNILPGMVIRQLTNIGSGTVTRSTTNTQSIFLAKVTEVTATTITLQETACTDLGTLTYSSNFRDGQIINAYFVDAVLENKISANNYPATGAYLEIFRSRGNAPLGVSYEIGILSLPHVQGDISTIYDDRIDSSLTVNIDDLEFGNELPRAGKYLSIFQNQIAQAGSPADASLKTGFYPSVISAGTTIAFCQDVYNELRFYTESMLCDFQSVYWADALTPEGFPQDGLHEFSIDTKKSDVIKAIAQNKDSLFAFKERTTAILSGDLALNDLVMEVLETEAGCVSHKTVEEVRGALIWLDEFDGFFACVAGRLPENIGFPIQDYQKINSGKLDYSKASAVNFDRESIYVCSVGTTTFVYDYADNGTLRRNCWYIWDRINGQSVLSTSDDKLLMYDGSKTWQMKLTNSIYDFSDHKSAIPLILNTSWSTQSAPTIDKHYVNLWINSIQGGFTLTVKQYGNFLEDVVGSQGDVVFIPENDKKKFVKQPVKAYFPKLSAISFGMENAQINKWVRIQGYEIQYAPDFAAGEPKR